VAFKIEKALTTLFGFYQLQSQGNLPVIVTETVQPVIDLNGHALAAAGLVARNFTQGTPFVGVIGGFTQVEDWYVMGANCQHVAGAGSEWALLSVDVQPAGGSGSAPYTVASMMKQVSSATWGATAAGETKISDVYPIFNQPFHTRRGTRWQLVCTGTGGGATGTAFGQVLYYPINQ
jgi:hypothetical protein